MSAHPQQRRFAKIAPDPARPSQQLCIRYDPRRPECAPILAMLEQTSYGELKTLVAQALRAGAAAELGQEPLMPPPATRRRGMGGGRFVITKRDTGELRAKERLFTVYDPRQTWNAHIESELAKCEWGETNRTMLRLLIEGLRRMGFAGSSSSTKAPLEQEPAAPRPATTPPPPVAAKGQDSSITIGIDPTRAAPKPVPTGATALLKGTGRRGATG